MTRNRTEVALGESKRVNGNVVELKETGRQPYSDAALSAGLVAGHEHDSIYLKFEREEGPTTILLRKDEALSIIWLLSGALWSEAIGAPDGDDG